MARTPLRRLRSDERGVASVEYALVLALVGVGATVAIAELGTLLLGLFRYQQTLLLLPFP